MLHTINTKTAQGCFKSRGFQASKQKEDPSPNKENGVRFALPRCWLSALGEVLVGFFFFFLNRKTSISGKLVSSGFEGLFLKPDSTEQRETLLYFAALRDERSNFEAGERGNRSVGVEQS